ncbi:MAG TPA: DUF1501 domain-containing protein [Armatimonadota bacterium]|nr:DUF1501 domain-containing protein [Armatimonadota bacterium]
MLKFGSIAERTCSGVSRREVLQVGSLGALGLSLPRALRAAEPGGEDLSVIVVFLRGGVSHIDTWDMKPESPVATVRGEFGAIETNVSGIRFCELLPLLARQADKLTLLHGASHDQDEHDNAMQTVLSGHPPATGLVYPNVGTVVARYKPGSSPLPSAIHVGAPGLGNPQSPPAPPEQRGLSAGLMGTAHNAFMIPDVQKLHEMDWLRSTTVLSDRLDRRRDLMRALDQFQKGVEGSSQVAHDTAYQRAFSVVTSPEAKRAFNLDSEPEALRERYGKHEFGQSCLLARRLIESGVRYAQVNWSARGWDAITAKDDLFTRSTFDSHFGHFPWLRRQLPRLDQGLSTLLADLADRGTLRKTLVVVLSEFGRANGVNADGGREHWPKAYTVLMAGGGLPGGRAVGSTDESGAEVTGGKFGPDALLNSVYGLCGLDVPVTLRQAGIVKDSSEGIPGLLP